MEQKIVKEFDQIVRGTANDITTIENQTISITNTNKEPWKDTFRDTFKKVIFNNVIFDNCVFNELRMDDCEFNNCTFKNISSGYVYFDLCRFRECKLESLHFDGQVRLTLSQFIDCKFGEEFKLDKMEIWHSSFVHCSTPQPMYIIGNGGIYEYIFPESNSTCCMIYNNNGHEVRSSGIKIEHMDSYIVKKILEIFNKTKE